MTSQREGLRSQSQKDDEIPPKWFLAHATELRVNVEGAFREMQTETRKEQVKFASEVETVIKQQLMEQRKEQGNLLEQVEKMTGKLDSLLAVKTEVANLKAIVISQGQSIEKNNEQIKLQQEQITRQSERISALEAAMNDKQEEWTPSHSRGNKSAWNRTPGPQPVSATPSHLLQFRISGIPEGPEESDRDLGKKITSTLTETLEKNPTYASNG